MLKKFKAPGSHCEKAGTLGPCYQADGANALDDDECVGCGEKVTIQKGGWQSPDTMPKDGKEFLVKFLSQSNVVMIYRWNGIHEYFESKGEPYSGLQKQNVVWHQIPLQDAE